MRQPDKRMEFSDFRAALAFAADAYSKGIRVDIKQDGDTPLWAVEIFYSSVRDKFIQSIVSLCKNHGMKVQNDASPGDANPHWHFDGTLGYVDLGDIAKEMG